MFAHTLTRHLKKCYDCRRQQATRQQQELAPLPAFRFPEDKPFPFQQTGLDIFGLFASKTAGNYNKRYGVIMTCLTTRAVYLETCQAQSADAFINTLRRFFARRGQPAKNVSDNGTNFTAAEKELNRHFDADVTRQFYANHQIEWTFNPALCSPFRRCMGTTHKISQRLVLCHHRKPDSNRRHHHRRPLRS